MNATTTMTGAELKARLGGLGLPPRWFGDRLGVTMRTVVRWFDGDHVEPRVADEIDLLSNQTLEEMLKIVEQANTRLESLPDEPVVLQTYRTDADMPHRGPFRGMPASWHRALVFRVWEHLRTEGHDVRIEYA